MNREPITINVTRQGYKPATVTLQPMDTVADRVSENWRELPRDLLDLDADTWVGALVANLCHQADALLRDMQESKARHDVISAVAFQSRVWLHG